MEDVIFAAVVGFGLGVGVSHCIRAVQEGSRQIKAWRMRRKLIRHIRELEDRAMRNFKV
ncbi:hypothetical protein KEU06_09170 [Pseudaminobacter sp. 19-2017]|uniref:Uncharacterized protein n=1 Tax=Pseudaminobacter soli (ex Zhang et al. 2022) TaxID=2831468 RepID=A0A942DW94_9HYPH|nr:hypothetical protein [Pseudaminobacter soli]MBS3648774.1 hypothetical protein [Pseudaminobacter soli]